MMGVIKPMMIHSFVYAFLTWMQRLSEGLMGS